MMIGTCKKDKHDKFSPDCGVCDNKGVDLNSPHLHVTGIKKEEHGLPEVVHITICGNCLVDFLIYTEEQFPPIVLFLSNFIDRQMTVKDIMNAEKE